jgi:hypothetical protein
MEKFFANLKRLLDPRAPTPAQASEQPTADRPPPLISTEPATAEPAPYQELAVQDAEPADDVSEIRMLLEAVGDAPAEAPAETVVETPAEAPEPVVEQSLQAPEPAPIPYDEETSEEPAPTFPSPSDALPAVEDSTPPPESVGGALVLTLANPAATFTVARTAATLGRGQENTVRLDDFSVSRRHARIAYRGGGYWLSDLGSMGGTWVDGAKLTAPRRIAAGQVIDIGVCRLTVSFAADREPIAARKSASKPRSEIVEQARRRR